MRLSCCRLFWRLFRRLWVARVLFRCREQASGRWSSVAQVPPPFVGLHGPQISCILRNCVVGICFSFSAVSLHAQVSATRFLVLVNSHSFGIIFGEGFIGARRHEHKGTKCAGDIPNVWPQHENLVRLSNSVFFWPLVQTAKWASVMTMGWRRSRPPYSMTWIRSLMGIYLKCSDESTWRRKELPKRGTTSASSKVFGSDSCCARTCGSCAAFLSVFIVRTGSKRSET